MLIYGFGNPPTAEAPKGIAECLFEAFLRRDSAGRQLGLRHVEGLERAERLQLGSTPARTVCSSSTTLARRTGADRRRVTHARGAVAARSAVALTITAPPISVNAPGDSPCTSQVHIGLSTGSISSSNDASSADTLRMAFVKNT